MNNCDAHLGACEIEDDLPSGGQMKYCTLKDISPGSTIELPKQYQSREHETAVVLGLEFNPIDRTIRTSFLRDTMIQLDLPPLKEDTKLILSNDRTLQDASLKAFIANKLDLPYLGMSCGCDPEIFVIHGDGDVFPAWEFMPSEDEARKLAKEWLKQEWKGKYEGSDHLNIADWDSLQNNICPEKVPAYWDGAQAEFAPWAKSCLETLHFGTRVGLETVLQAARLKDPRAKLTLQNVIALPDEVLRNGKDKHIQFRCSRSYNVYNDPGDGVPNARQYKYRCAGGHIHIGYTRKFTAPGIEQIVRGLDGVLGIAGVSLAAGVDNPERRHTYGRAGEFRLPEHGMEYRVLSNFWLSHPALAMLVFELARGAVRLAESGLYNLCWVGDEKEIRDVINNCDVKGARAILHRNAAVLMGMLHWIWVPQDKRPEDVCSKMRILAMRTILNGMEAAIKDPYDIEGNWKLNNPEAWKVHCRGENDSWKSLSINS